MKAEDLDQDDLTAALREHGLERVEDTRLVVLERIGDQRGARETDGEALQRSPDASARVGSDRGNPGFGTSAWVMRCSTGGDVSVL